MQQRYHVAFAQDFPSAHKLKVEEQKKNPKANFQIRARKNNFELVGRISVAQAITARETLPGSTMYAKRKKPRKLYGQHYTPKVPNGS